MEVHRAQATPTPSEHSIFPFINDFLSSSSHSSSDYGSDCSTLPPDGSVNGNREYSPSDDSSVYVSSALRLASEVQSEYAFNQDDNIHIKPDSVILICTQCQQQIQDKFFVSVDGRSWHDNCLQCSTCDNVLSNKCFYKDRKFYCKGCYFRQLSTGEEYALQEGNLLCKQHYLELVEGDTGVSNQKAKTKRVRTTFADDQLSVLQNYFNRDSNPDGADLEKIANMTGLSKRVTQVWFQNSRARQKKWHQKSEGDNEGSQRSSVGPLSPGQKSDSSNDMIYPTSVTTR
ncbi:unnamed protein product [Caenorhabditis brenneri]